MRPGVADCPQWTRFRGSRPQQRRPGRTWYGRPRQTSFHVDVPSTGTFSAATGSNRKTNFHSWPQLGEVVPAGTGSTMALWLMDVAQPGQALIARPGIGDHCGALGQMGRGVSGPVDPSGGERRGGMHLHRPGPLAIRGGITQRVEPGLGNGERTPARPRRPGKASAAYVAAATCAGSPSARAWVTARSASSVAKSTQPRYCGTPRATTHALTRGDRAYSSPPSTSPALCRRRRLTNSRPDQRSNPRCGGMADAAGIV
jgi:hypothetical protein